MLTCACTIICDVQHGCVSFLRSLVEEAVHVPYTHVELIRVFIFNVNGGRCSGFHFLSQNLTRKRKLKCCLLLLSLEEANAVCNLHPPDHRRPVRALSNHWQHCNQKSIHRPSIQKSSTFAMVQTLFPFDPIILYLSIYVYTSRPFCIVAVTSFSAYWMVVRSFQERYSWSGIHQRQETEANIGHLSPQQQQSQHQQHQQTVSSLVLYRWWCLGRWSQNILCLAGSDFHVPRHLGSCTRLSSISTSQCRRNAERC